MGTNYCHQTDNIMIQKYIFGLWNYYFIGTNGNLRKRKKKKRNTCSFQSSVWMSFWKYEIEKLGKEN